MFTFGLGIFGIVLLLVAIASVFWLWMLVDCLTSRSLEPTEKLIWVLVIFFGHLLGALLYFVIARKTR